MIFFFRFQKMGQQEMIISAVCWRLATYVVVWYDCVVFLLTTDQHLQQADYQAKISQK